MTKKIGLMQAYLFPYIGYFQLINIVDEFIIYDDVQWIKGGWINRNRILDEAGGIEYLTLPVSKDSYRKNINERFFVDDFTLTARERIIEVYSNAPYFSDTLAVIDKCFSYEEKNVALFVANSIKLISEYMGISTNIVISSEAKRKKDLHGQDRVIDIVKQSQGDEYINAVGGQELYDKTIFRENGIKLSFVKTNIIEYSQQHDQFVPYLSVIDIMMFNSKESISRMLNSYDLI